MNKKIVFGLFGLLFVCGFAVSAARPAHAVTIAPFTKNDAAELQMALNLLQGTLNTLQARVGSASLPDSVAVNAALGNTKAILGGLNGYLIASAGGPSPIAEAPVTQPLLGTLPRTETFPEAGTLPAENSAAQTASVSSVLKSKTAGIAVFLLVLFLLVLVVRTKTKKEVRIHVSDAVEPIVDEMQTA